MADLPVTLADIERARGRISASIYRSPCPYSLSLSRLCSARVHCKLDHLQITGSFKERGARNKLEILAAQGRRGGVIAASAGNHALGLAYHGQAMGIKVTVVMPRWAPLIKVSNCRSFAAEVILHGETFAEAYVFARAEGVRRDLAFIPGFDDCDIIAGQGTLGLEILEDVPDCDTVLVPIGGGGLIAGIAVAIKAIKPSVRVIGVETRSAPTMHASLAAGRVVRIDARPTLADGLAVAEAGAICFEIVRALVDQVVLVDEPAIARAVVRLLELEKTVVEGAGAVPLAAAMDPALGLAGSSIVLLLCGGNIDLTTVARVIERGLASDGRLWRFTAEISERPGSLAALLSVVAQAGASIKDVDHDRSFTGADVAQVAVSCVVETRDHAHIEELRTALRTAGVVVTAS